MIDSLRKARRSQFPRQIAWRPSQRNTPVGRTCGPRALGSPGLG